MRWIACAALLAAGCISRADVAKSDLETHDCWAQYHQDRAVGLSGRSTRARCLELAQRRDQAHEDYERQQEDAATAARLGRGALFVVGTVLQSASYSRRDPPREVDVYVVPGCSSDFDCGSGARCVKKNFSGSGSCMQSVDAAGAPAFDQPRLESVNVKTPSPSDCSAGRVCPAGFQCDWESGACVR